MVTEVDLSHKMPILSPFCTLKETFSKYPFLVSPSTVRMSLPISRSYLKSMKGYLRREGLKSEMVSFSSSFFLEVAWRDLLAFAAKRAMNSLSSAARCSAFLLASFCWRAMSWEV